MQKHDAPTLRVDFSSRLNFRAAAIERQVQPFFVCAIRPQTEDEASASRKPWRIQRAEEEEEEEEEEDEEEEEEALVNPVCMYCVADNKCRFGICWLRLSISERVEQDILSVNGATTALTTRGTHLVRPSVDNFGDTALVSASHARFGWRVALHSVIRSRKDNPSLR
jgi:hypothetical protein